MTISHRLFRNLYISVLGHYVTTAFVAILLSFFTYYFAVLQKTIVNKGIVGRHFPQLFFGREFEQVPYLTVLCSILLVLGLTLVGLRWLTRRQQQKFGARLTEAMVRRVADVEAPPQIMVRDIEYAQAFDELHSRYIPTFSQPILGGITLISLAFFIFIQDPILGAASVTTFPMRGFFTKRIRRRLSSPSAVPSSDAPGVRAFVLNATRMAETRRQFDLLSRYVTLFLVLSVGGYMVIHGELSFGALLAVIFILPEIDLLWQQMTEWLEANPSAQRAYGHFLSRFERDKDSQVDSLVLQGG